ncbi:MAG: MMPL family transporter [Lachnospiraceae bacterium]|nr:MMPL family transporter [Lachnospiraceae bacterium]
MLFAKAVVKCRHMILIVTLALMIPSFIGMAATRINYDMLDYLPGGIDTVEGQDILLDEFGKGAFSMIVVEGMEDKDVVKLKEKIEAIDHVETVVWYDSLFDISVPKEMLPTKVLDAFNNGKCTMMAVFYDTSTSADETLDAIRAIRNVAGNQCFVSGMSAMVTDLKALCEGEEPIYVAMAAVLACLAMIVFLDGWLVPFVFLASVGMMIMINLGTNIFLGEISYITKALSAVLQLAVTVDYSIFLWHCYNEKLGMYDNKEEAMTYAIKDTMSSVVGSSVTTIAGFVALCFMSFTLGLDLGIVMAKGVALGVIGCVTVLPSMVLILDKPLQKTKHKSVIPDMSKFARKITKIAPVFVCLFLVLIPPAYFGYAKTNDEVYYDIGKALPKDMDYVIANDKLIDEFDVASTYMILVDKNMADKNKRSMIDEMKKVDGVKSVLGMESVVGSAVPQEIIPTKINDVFRSDHWELMIINSSYKIGTDEVGKQIEQLNSILKGYDNSGMLIGEAPCMKDLTDIMGHDFQVVNSVSVIAIFVIILCVTRSITLPFILISVIELAIFINLGLPHYLGQQIIFIAPICISTIQLGATVDYAILMTTRYKTERFAGKEKKEAIDIALGTSIPSIIVSGMGLFAATFGVALYSKIDIISSICMLLARGAVISMLMVIFVLPALLMVFDKLICHTTMGMRPKKAKAEAKHGTI